MGIKKNRVMLGGAVLSGLALITSVTARYLSKRHSKDIYKLNARDMLLNLNVQLSEVREALLRSYATGLKLRDDNAKLRAAVVELAGENAPVLLEIGAAPEEDSYVSVIVDRESLYDTLDACEMFCDSDSDSDCIGCGCPLFVKYQRCEEN